MDIDGDEGSDDITVQSRQLSSNQCRQGIQPLQYTGIINNLKLQK